MATSFARELTEEKAIVHPTQALLLRDSRIRVLKFIVEWTEEDTPAVLAKQVAHFVKLSGAHTNVILRELVAEGILTTNEYDAKCFVCEGTGKSSAMHGQNCIACRGNGTKHISPKPILYSVNRKAEGKLHWMFRCIENLRGLKEQEE